MTTTSSLSLKSTTGPAKGGDLAATKSPVRQQGDDRAVDQAAALGGLLALEAAAGAGRPEASGADGGAIVVGSEASGPAGAGSGEVAHRLRSVCRRAELGHERPDGRLRVGLVGAYIASCNARFACGRGRCGSLSSTFASLVTAVPLRRRLWAHIAHRRPAHRHPPPPPAPASPVAAGPAARSTSRAPASGSARWRSRPAAVTGRRAGWTGGGGGRVDGATAAALGPAGRSRAECEGRRRRRHPRSRRSRLRSGTPPTVPGPPGPR